MSAMAEGLALNQRRFEAPFQLYDDLRCPRLKDYPPVAQAAHEVRYKRAQERQGVVRLAELRMVP